MQYKENFATHTKGNSWVGYIAKMRIDGLAWAHLGVMWYYRGEMTLLRRSDYIAG
jgi:hypothetical protein